jgi:hypothetical protein
MVVMVCDWGKRGVQDEGLQYGSYAQVARRRVNTNVAS